MIKGDGKVYSRSRQRGMMNDSHVKQQHCTIITIKYISDVNVFASGDPALKLRMIDYFKHFKQYSMVVETGEIFAAIGNDGQLQAQVGPLYVEIMTRD